MKKKKKQTVHREATYSLHRSCITALKRSIPNSSLKGLTEMLCPLKIAQFYDVCKLTEKNLKTLC